jgi:hypothetical protein
LAIFEAIKKRDPEAAAQAMADHMASASKHLHETLSNKIRSDGASSSARAFEQIQQQKNAVAEIKK